METLNFELTSGWHCWCLLFQVTPAYKYNSFLLHFVSEAACLPLLEKRKVLLTPERLA